MTPKKTAKAKVREVYPDALCVSDDASYGIGTLKVYNVWTAKDGKRLAGATAASEAWRRSAKKMEREAAPAPEEVAAVLAPSQS